MQEKLNQSTEASDAFEDQFTAKSMLQIFVEQFLNHRLALAGAALLMLLLIITSFAPMIASTLGVSRDAQNVFHRFAPPGTSTEIAKGDQELFVEKWIIENTAAARRLKVALGGDSADEEVIYALLDKPSEDATNILEKNSHIPETKTLREGFKQFKSYHVLGTDELGRDVLVRLIYGARVSLGIGLVVALVSASFGLVIGLIAGYYGGIIDAVIGRIIDGLLSIPVLPLMIVFAAVNLQEVPLIGFVLRGNSDSIAKLVLILCLFSWMNVARLVRASTLALRERDFVLAAKTLGAKDRLILFSHIAPNALGPLLVAITLGIGDSILSEASLSFLGLGIQPPVPSWGNILFNAQELIHHAPLQAILPGVLILIAVVSFNFVGDGIQDAIEPRSIKR